MSYNRRKTLAQLVTEATGNDPESKALCGNSLKSMIEEIADCVEFVGKTISISTEESIPGMLMIDPINFEGRKHFDIECIKSDGRGGFWMLRTPDEDDYKKGAEIVGKISFVSPGIHTVEKDSSVVPMSGPTGLLAYCDIIYDTPEEKLQKLQFHKPGRKIAPDFKERVTDILSSFLFEYNDEQTQKEIKATLGRFFDMQESLGYAKPEAVTVSPFDDCGLSIGLLFVDHRKYYDFFLSNGEINVSVNSGAKEISIDGCIGTDGPSGPNGICVSDNIGAMSTTTSTTGSANWIVCGGAVATALQNTAQFITTTSASASNTASSNSLMSIGTMSGMSVYVDPNAPAHTILVGHKGPEKEEMTYMQQYCNQITKACADYYNPMEQFEK